MHPGPTVNLWRPAPDSACCKRPTVWHPRPSRHTVNKSKHVKGNEYACSACCMSSMSQRVALASTAWSGEESSSTHGTERRATVEPASAARRSVSGTVPRARRSWAPLLPWAQAVEGRRQAPSNGRFLWEEQTLRHRVRSRHSPP